MEAQEEGGISFCDPIGFPIFLDRIRHGLPAKQEIIDYFSASAFYERECDNEAIFMQNRIRADEESLKSQSLFVQYKHSTYLHSIYF